MADVQQSDSGGGDKKHKKVRAKKASTHIDMTPMVDLAFLLLTFFILTTTFSKPKTMEINMPVKSNDSTKVKDSLALTILLTGNNKIVWYKGIGDDPNKPPETHVADFSLTDTNSIHKVILDRNERTYDKVKAIKDSVEKGLLKEDIAKQHIGDIKADKNGIVVLIKPDSLSKYKNVVDILDEMAVCAVGRFAIVDIPESDKELLKTAK